VYYTDILQSSKIAATLDVLSKGRLFLGIGASYFQGESSAYGIISSGLFPSNQERLLRLEEAIQIIRKMWSEEPSASFNGTYTKLTMHAVTLNQYRNLHRLC
jgi:alkanesulfonate monooxygenase SsuD/methylene tetrahydromethanopterin reductase-like flavin-dependent oxidoreductase (luciferase family)